MVGEAQDFKFELSTGNLYAAQVCIEQVEAGQAPRNLLQLHALGKLLVSPTALLEPISKEGSDEVVALPLLLRSERYEYLSHGVGYTPLDVQEWQAEDYLSYGSWLNAIVDDPSSHKPQLNQLALRRAYNLGLGPSDSKIISSGHFTNLTDFQRALGIIPIREKHRYTNWSETELADHAEKVLLEQLEAWDGSGKAPSLAQELHRRARLDAGPSPNTYRRKGTSPMRLLNERGYVYPAEWEEKDYIEWLVKFMEANDGHTVTKEAVDFLVKSRRAPSWSTITGQFKVEDYRQRGREAYAQRMADRRSEVLAEVQEDPDLAIAISDKTDQRIVGIRARWRMLNELIPGRAVVDKLLITMASPSLLVMAIQRFNDIGKEDIHATAKRLGVHDDIWPPAYMEYLRVPEELLE